MEMKKCDKMIIAVLQSDDYRDVIEELNENGFYVTILRSSGGFLKKSSATIMIGLEEERLETAIAILKNYGERVEMQYGTNAVPSFSIPSVPLPVHTGGVTLFVLDVNRFEKF